MDRQDVDVDIQVDVNDMDLGPETLELKSHIQQQFNCLEEDGNHGIDVFLQVKEFIINLFSP